MPKRPPYEVAHLSEIPHTPTDAAAHGLAIPGVWKQIRHHFGIREFSVNAFVATEAGQEIVHEHSERANDDPLLPGDEELYFVATGRARVRLGEEEVEAGAEDAAAAVRQAWREAEEFNLNASLLLEALFVRVRRAFA